MALTTMGSIKSHDPLCIWEVVGLKLNNMVFDGLIEKENLEIFNLPYYASTTKDVEDHAYSDVGKKARAKLATDIRAVEEPVMATQFGEVAMDDLFCRSEAVVLHHMEMENCQYINLVISLTKKR
ncbi:hypothetical protein ACFX2I_002991 [Malus domestica]